VFAHYDRTRDDLAADVHGTSTTRLSRHLKFGTISVREMYWAVFDAHGLHHPLLRELYFREFYYILAWHEPRVLAGQLKHGRSFSTSEPSCPDEERGEYARNEPFDRRFLGMAWRDVGPGSKGERLLRAWQEGRTGVPLVDAAMRQLNCTGFMHNRCRMVVAMYLTKELFIDWREGERYFASRLVDYDPVQNSAGWQWSASVGSDAAPYFRVFNPFVQQARFDPGAVYVRHWVPELDLLVGGDASKARALSKWDSEAVRSWLRGNCTQRADTGNAKARKGRGNIVASTCYPDPILVDRRAAVEATKAAYRNHLSTSSRQPEHD